MSVTRPAFALRFYEWLQRQVSGAHTQALIKRASAVFLMQVAGAGAMFLYGILLGRQLGAGDYGRYSFAVTLITVLRIGANLGLPMMMMRTVSVYQDAKDWAQLKGLLRFAAGTTLGSGTVCALLAAAVVVLTAGHPYSQTSILILLALPLLVVLPVSETAAGAIRGLQHVSSGQGSEFVRSTLYLVLLVVVVWGLQMQLSAGTAIVLRFIAEAIGMVFTLVMLMRLLPREVRPATAITGVSEWRKGQLSFIAIDAMYLIYQQTDVLVLGVMRPMDEVGVYRMAVNLSFILAFASVIASAVLGPLAASAWASGRREELRDASVRLSRLAFVLTLALFIALLIGAPILIGILGRDFAGLTVPLVILGISHVIRALMSASPMIVLMTGSERAAAWGIAASALANLVLNFAFIPLLGMNGSALATAISSTLMMVFYTMLAYRRTGISGAVLFGPISFKRFLSRR